MDQTIYMIMYHSRLALAPFKMTLHRDLLWVK